MSLCVLSRTLIPWVLSRTLIPCASSRTKGAAVPILTPLAIYTRFCTGEPALSTLPTLHQVFLAVGKNRVPHRRADRDREDPKLDSESLQQELSNKLR